MSLSKIDLGLEAIALQSGKLHEELTVEIANLRGKEVSEEDLKKSNISNIIKLHTGLSVNMNIENDSNPNAFIILYKYGYDDLLFSGFDVNGKPVLEDLVEYKVYKTKIDEKNARITGKLAEKSFDIYLTSGLFKKKSFTAAEISAIIIHELGHAFTLIQFVTDISFFNLLSHIAAKKIMGDATYSNREITIARANELADVKMPEKEKNTLLNTDAKNIELLLFKSYVERYSVRTKTSNVTHRNCEQLADNFVTKHGAGVDAVKVLSRVYNEYGMLSMRKKSNMAHLITEALRLFLFHPFGIGVKDAMVATLEVNHTYDNPIERFVMIEKSLINELKSTPTSNKKVRDKLIEDIDTIKAVRASVYYKRDLLTYIHQTYTKAGKSEKQLDDLQKKIESLLNSDLHLQSAKLRQLTNKG